MIYSYDWNIVPAQGLMRNLAKKIKGMRLLSSGRKRGDTVLEDLFEKYSHAIYFCCFKYLKNREESQDAMMDVFRKCMETLETREIRFFSSWFYVTARNHCLNLLKRRQQKNRYLTQADAQPDYEKEYDDTPFPNNSEYIDASLHAAIDELQTDQQTCIRLFYFENQCYQEIADQCGYTLKQVKTYLQNGRRNLKIKIEERIGAGYEYVR